MVILLWHFLLISSQVVSSHCYFLPVRWCHLRILSNFTNFHSFLLSLAWFSWCFFTYGLNKEGDWMHPYLAPLLVGSHPVSMFCLDSGFLSTAQVTHRGHRVLSCAARRPLLSEQPIASHSPHRGFTVVNKTGWLPFWNSLQHFSISVILSVSLRLVSMEKGRESYRDLLCVAWF